ncbi:MAG: TetR/AcrR family transcriptional regulator [Phenylobacterium sp.]|uniref:TetR/AcrR family transcriptional regulator n=1 Tax=Phenylobacterium sp. TaxID=1871053 RepID=UPI002724A5D7|nr:TetR/AcrR family transcriptional regulator [Phenylobacterium sp.]MDO9430310.1 TetR/AcrR family transcriptional regulator [Phenylobacterium sp.]
MTSSPPGTRQPRGRARRTAVLEAARRLFSRQGFKGASLAAIAQEAGLTDAGLLYHFPTKNHLLLAVIAEGDREQDETLEQVRDARGLPLLLRMAEFGADLEADPILTALDVTLSAEHLQDGSEINAYFVQRYESFRAMLAEAFREAAQAGDLRADLDPDLEAANMTAVLDGLRLQWLLSGGAVSMADGMRAYVQGLIKGLSASQP